MERPDLDAIEAADRRIGNIRNGDLEEVIAYARHLEARISELEAALEPLTYGPISKAQENAARVLRKGAQHGE